MRAVRVFVACFFFLNIGFIFSQIPKEFVLSEPSLKEIIRQGFLSDTVLDISVRKNVFGLGVTGVVSLHSDSSLIRISVVDSSGDRYLVYEDYPLLSGQDSSVFTGVGIETTMLEGIIPQYLFIEVVDAALWIEALGYSFDVRLNKRTDFSYENYVIQQLNANLRKGKALWRAGRTSLSGLSFEEKSSVFGGNLPNTGGFEYYVGGIFTMPGVLDALSGEKSRCVPFWDWRNRHGKNWITVVKDQDTCGACWAFSAAAAVEAYANLYYNRLLDLDLSEQELISCSPYSFSCGGGLAGVTLGVIAERGVVDEECYPYLVSNSDCQYCSSPNELLSFEYEIFDELSSEDELKQQIFRAPVTLGLENWGHEVLLIGYKTLQEGDTVYLEDVGGGESEEWMIISQGSPLAGKTAWLIKNSYGAEWGEGGFGWIVTDWESTKRNWTALGGKVSSLQYGDEDILVTDNDGDGYYFWGIGEKPSGLPAWIPDTPDGNDADPNKGPLNSFGFEQNLSPDSLVPIVIREEVLWDSRKQVNPFLIVEEGGELIIKAEVFMNRDSEILVKSGGKLIVDGGTINQACVRILAEGMFVLQGDGQLKRGANDTFEAQPGSRISLLSGVLW